MPFFELSVPFEQAKQKGKQISGITPSERQSLEARIDALVQLGYTAIAINHVVQSKFQAAIPDFALRKREGIIILKRLTIVLDDAGEKGCGLTTNNATELSTYDLIAIQPTTQSALSQACLTYSLPGPLTAHIISLDIASQPRLPFYLKHTLVRNAIRNGAVFEIHYAPAVAPDDEHRRRNWWANAREVVRVTKGKNLVLSGGATALADLRAPLDIANLATLLDVAQDQARNALSTTPQSLVLRAQTRKTYRAVLSEPKLILSDGTVASTSSTGTASKAKAMDIDILPNPNEGSEALLPTSSTKSTAGLGKRARDDANETSPQDGTSKVETGKKKKKKKQHPDSSVVKT